ARRILTMLQARDAIREPIVLTIDDVHLCDRGSQELLGYLGLHGAAFGLRCIMTADEAADLGPFGSLDRLPLPPLDLTELRILLEHATGMALPYRVASILHAVSGGNPLLAVDLAAQLSSSELQGTTPIGLPRLPSRAAIDRLGVQVRTLSEDEMTVLAVFARCRSLPLTLLPAAGDAPEAVVDRLVQDRWLTVHQRIAAPRRRSDALVAWALTASSAQRALSRRLSTAVRPTRPAAADYYAAQGGDLEAAGRLVQGAAMLYESQDSPLAAATANLARHGASPVGLQDGLVLAQLLTADGFFDAAQEQLRQLQKEPGITPSEVMELVADLAAFTGDPSEALPRIDFQNLPHDRLDTWLRAVLTVCRVQLALDGPDEARRLVAAAGPAVAVASEETAAVYAVVRAELETYAEGASARFVLHQAIRRWRTKRTPGVDIAMVTAVLDLLSLGQISESRDLLLSSGSPQQLTYATARAAFLTVRVETEIATGRFRRAAASLVDLDRELPCSTAGDLMVASQAVRINAACGYVEECQAIEARLDRSTAPVLSYPERGASAAAEGYRELVHRRYRRSRGLLSLALRGPALLPQGRTDALADLVEATVADGDRPAARTLLEQHSADLPDRDGERAPGLLARCEALVGDPADVDDLFQAALGRHQPTHEIDHARTLLAYARVLIELGRDADASRPLTEAAAAFHQSGLVGWERHVAALVDVRADFGVAGSPRVRLDELTSMERDVVDLVLQRSRNRDIARHLFVSLRTVEAHLTRIFRKLDVPTKAQLIRLVTDDPITDHAAAHSTTEPQARVEPAYFPASPQERPKSVSRAERPGHDG
ncbi:MAG: LuxR C-terminal-related transcriptional regulator, partial [Pseudonocardiales bacterium]